MERTWIGLGFGAACGLTIGFGVCIAFNGWSRVESEVGIVTGLLMAGAGAATGAVVGGVADILKSLRVMAGRSATSGPESDYREPDRPA
jgi:hypothetical protein